MISNQLKSFVLALLYSYNVSSLHIHTRTYRISSIPKETFATPVELESKSLLHCELQASRLKFITFTFHYERKTCQVAVRSILQLNEQENLGDKIFVWSRVLPKRVGLSQGNTLEGRDFNVILPSGQVCPGELNHLPMYDAGVSVHTHSLTEEAGIIYLCGGIDKDKANIGLCHKLDLNEADPTWISMPGLDGRHSNRMAPRGLISYTNVNGDLALFAFFVNMCHLIRVTQDEFIRIFINNTWSEVGKVQFDWGMIVREDHLVFLVGGHQCQSSRPFPTTKRVQVFDMSEPIKDAVTFVSRSMSVNFPACAMVWVSLGHGILCAGGRLSVDGPSTDVVQFLPISGKDSSGPCQEMEPLPKQRRDSHLFVFSTGEGVIYGSGPNGNETLVWSNKTNKFSIGHPIHDNPKNAAMGSIDTNLILQACWDLF